MPYVLPQVIRPDQWLTSSLAVETGLITRRGLTRGHRGVVLSEPATPAGAPSRTPPAPVYRRAPDTPEYRPVVVRLLDQELQGDPGVERLLTRVNQTRHALPGGLAPRLLFTLGRGGRVAGSVEEYVAGTTVETLVGSREGKKLMSHLLPAGGHTGPLPAAIALAIARELVPLLSRLVGLPARPHLFTDRVLLETSGRVRVLPEYREETSRQDHGAALLLLSDMYESDAPEEWRGQPGDERSSMYTLGLLLYEMLSGDHPFHRPGVSPLTRAFGEEHQRVALPLREHRDDLPPPVIQFVHRCLAEDPARRFSSWRELIAALTGVQALVAPTGQGELAAYVRHALGQEPSPKLPLVEFSPLSAGTEFPYEIVPLPARSEREREPREPSVVTAVDPASIYLGRDARPMLALSSRLAIDARPVTRAEFERFLLTTATAAPAHVRSVDPQTDDAACVSVPAALAEAYARWAGKRLPTEAEWATAAATLGPERLGLGVVWEWTATASEQGGRVVCGGRWRDQLGMAPAPNHRSFVTDSAPDVGWRCVVDVSFPLRGD